MNFLRTIVLTLTLSLFSAPAFANVIINFSGIVDRFNPGPFTRLVPLYGSIELDTSVVPTETSPGSFLWDQVMTSFSITIAEPTGNVTYTGSGGRVRQFPSSGSGVTEFIQVNLGGIAGGTMDSPFFNDYTARTFSIDFRGVGLWADPGVLATGLTEADFSYSRLDFQFDHPTAGVIDKLMVERSLDTVTFSGGVPAPGALALLGLGLIGLGLAKRKT